MACAKKSISLFIKIIGYKFLVYKRAKEAKNSTGPMGQSGLSFQLL
jgi:hypothetical protein